MLVSQDHGTLIKEIQQPITTIEIIDTAIRHCNHLKERVYCKAREMNETKRNKTVCENQSLPDGEIQVWVCPL